MVYNEMNKTILKKPDAIMMDGHEIKHFVIYADAGHFTPTVNNFKLLS